ncbi:Omp85 family outer membrane protein [Pleomorphovibrio marinus]|uniref:Omp85 family outer membrane protein n=1 Tax=Pleomorphovibrio marinus TaxID=2164132 RepID=UPI0013001D51|nr:DUF5982 domain-containing protein [Pleomorphovibrio marinus]
MATAIGQQTFFIGTSTQDTAVVKGSDTLELPFPLSKEKRLSFEDIINKKENWYSTGLPEMTIDPIRGLSVGGNAFLFNNNDRDDPFFYYTPYRIRYGVGFRIAQNGRVAGELNIDIPYVFNTKWRLRGDIIYADDPNFQYFGIGEQTLDPLHYQDKLTGNQVNRARFNDYAHNLAITRPGRLSTIGEDPTRTYTDLHYNEVDYNQFLVGLVAERSFFEGRMRLMVGLEYLNIGITHYDFQNVPGAIDPITGEEKTAIQGQTRITEDFRQQSIDAEGSFWARHNIGGYDGGRIMLLQTGLMWDTRDLEPDPSSGFFAELAQEVSYGWMGSEFDFTKHLVQGVFYEKLFPRHLSKTVLTGRLAVGYVRGNNIPFTEVLDLWGSSEGGGIPVLGGARALRGYRESRFAGMVTTLANLEIRSRFHQMRIWNQHLAFYAVPFFDAGRVYDSFANIEMRNFRYNPGLGARIAWNQATILRLDYARSQEDSQFFFVFGHTF